MTTLTNLISPFLTNTLRSDTYEVVENEVVTSQNYKGLTVSGSLFTHTLFKNVTFDFCAFYATKFIGCEFSGCKFTNCNFQFTTIENSDFYGCEFIDNTWVVSSISNSCLSTCFIDLKTSFYLIKEDNFIKDCFTSKAPSWEDIDMETEFIDMTEQTLIKKAS